MSEINYNYNYENRSTSSVKSIVWQNAEITECTYAQMTASTVENGKFYHTTDTNEFYFGWNDSRIKLNVTGDSNVESLIEQAQQALDDANTAVSAATSAATRAENAAQAMSAYSDHFTDNDIHIFASERTKWNAKQDALSTEQINAITAVSGKQDKFANETVLSGITASQVSSWEAVAAGSYDNEGAANTALSSAKSYTDTQISGLNWVKSVNGATGDVTVRTFTLIDDSIDGINFEGSLKEFCDSLENTLHPQAGIAYLAEVSFMKKVDGDDGYDSSNLNNNIGMPYTVGNGELLIYVPIEGLYELEMHSTNAFDNYGNPGKWMAMYQDGDIISPWRGFMAANYEKINVGTSESPSYKYEYIAHNDSDGISKYYLEHIYQPLTSVQISAITAVSGKQDALANADVLSAISQADIDNWNAEAAEAEVSKGYVDAEVSSALSSAKAYTDTAIANISISGAGVSEEFVTSTIATSLSGYATESYVSTAVSNRTVEKLDGTNGYAQILNEADGGGIFYVQTSGDKVESFVGVHNEGDAGNGIAAQIYADRYIEGTGWEGAKLDVTNGGIYYTVGHDSPAARDVAANELATKGDISTATSDMATQDWVGQQGFLTSHQSLDDYATETYVATSISAAVSNKLTALPSLSYEGAPGGYNIPYSFTFTPNPSKLTVTISTLTLDNNLSFNGFDNDLPSATTSIAGLMSAADKAKLDGISSVSLPTTAISQDWETELPTLSENGDKYVTANDVIAFIQDAILKKKSEVDDGSESDTNVYFYANGYLTNGGTETDTTILNKFTLDTSLSSQDFYISVGAEYGGDEDLNQYGVYFRIDLPSGYKIANNTIKMFSSINNDYTDDTPLKENVRGAQQTHNNISYNSYIRSADGDYYDNIGPAKYKITIERD